MDADRVFVETNVLVYGIAEASPWHDAALSRMEQLSSGHELWTSRQVLREILATGTRHGQLWWMSV